jgi:hypothetical protein
MMAILAKKKVAGARAARAIIETLDLAASVYLVERRRHMWRSRIDRGQHAAEELCRRLDSFVSKVAALPPNSKHSLKQCIERSAAGGFFDTEIFFSLLDAIASTLPDLSPKVRANAADAALFGGSPSTRLLWEELDAGTRRRCEIAVEAKPRRDISLFRMLADALRTYSHPLRCGPRPSVLRDYARSVDRIWHRLGIIEGRRRYDLNARKNLPTGFTQFANEALAAVGIDSRVSDRQIRQAIRERKKREKRPNR